MIVLSFIQVESNYDKKEPWERVCGFLIEVLSLFKFRITEIWCYYFWIQVPTKKKIFEMNNFWYFFKKR